MVTYHFYCIFRNFAPELIQVSVAWSDWEYFYFPVDGMLVHRRVTPSIKFAGTHLYTWVERGTVRVKCLAQEHNATTPARARTRAARPGDERTNHVPLHCGEYYPETKFIMFECVLFRFKLENVLRTNGNYMQWKGLTSPHPSLPQTSVGLI